MLARAFNTIQGAFTLFIFMSIVGVSVVTVLALNPRANIDDQAQSSVSGIEVVKTSDVNSQKYITPLKIDNLAENTQEYQTQFSRKNDKSVYNVRILSESKGSIKEKFIRVKNYNDFEIRLNLQTSIIGGVSDLVKVKLVDGVDDVVLWSSKDGLYNRSVAIPANGERTFELEIETIENINFPFEINFELR